MAELNGNVFLREYTFASNQFHSGSGQEYELADHIVLLPAAVLVFQAKERDESADTSDASIERWFKREVLKHACKQLADTRRFFEDERDLSLPNQRGHIWDLAGSKAHVIQVALYSSGKTHPPLLARTNHRQSSKAGFVHILNVRDYHEVCRILALPAEIEEYFDFREEFLLGHDSWVHREDRLLAAFITEQSPESIDDDAAEAVLADALLDFDSFDLCNVLRKFGEKAYYHEGHGSGTDYYAVLNEFAYMNRSERRGFRRLLDWAVEKAGGPLPEFPARMLMPQRGTGFLVFPVPKGTHDLRLNALTNFTQAAKYDWRLQNQVGVSVARDNDQIEIDWAYESSPWVPDREMEDLLAANYPFRPTPEPKIDYRYRQSSE